MASYHSSSHRNRGASFSSGYGPDPVLAPGAPPIIQPINAANYNPTVPPSSFHHGDIPPPPGSFAIGSPSRRSRRSRSRSGSRSSSSLERQNRSHHTASRSGYAGTGYTQSMRSRRSEEYDRGRQGAEFFGHDQFSRYQPTNYTGTSRYTGVSGYPDTYASRSGYSNSNYYPDDTYHRDRYSDRDGYSSRSGYDRERDRDRDRYYDSSSRRYYDDGYRRSSRDDYRYSDRGRDDRRTRSSHDYDRKPREQITVVPMKNGNVQVLRNGKETMGDRVRRMVGMDPKGFNVIKLKPGQRVAAAY